MYKRQDKYNEVSENLEISNTEFMHLKFDEKIEVLKPYLPEVLVANKNIYGIVSKGIHAVSYTHLDVYKRQAHPSTTA